MTISLVKDITTNMQRQGKFALLIVTLMTSLVVECVPCTLSNTNGGIRMDCKNRRKTFIPNKCSTSITWLDISLNNLTEVNGLTSPCFSELRHLDLSSNLLHFVPSETLQHLNKLEWLDLSYNNLGFIPSNAFQGLDHLEFLALCHTGLVNLTQDSYQDLPSLLTLNLSENKLIEIPELAIKRTPLLHSLNLGYNAITVVKNMTFANISTLQYLDLKGNALVTLERDAFVGLDQLVELDLSNNRLILSHIAYPAGVFSPLTALQSLKLHGNDDNKIGEYPENVFTPLNSLKSLTIDTFIDAHFGSEFSSLTNLNSLDLSFDCKISHLSNSTFEAFHNSSLETINVSGCRQMSSYELCAFCYLPSLKSLYLQTTGLKNLNDALGLLYGLQFQNMSTIDLYSCCRKVAELEARDLEFLNNICVERLSLAECYITYIAPSFFTRLIKGLLVKCIRDLDFQSNSINLQMFLAYRLLIKSVNFRNLESIHIGDQRIHEYSKISCFYMDNCKDIPAKESESQYTIRSQFTPTLQYLDLSGMYWFGPLPKHIDIVSAGNVTYLGLSTSGINRCDSTITGLSGLGTFDLSGNDCKILNVNIFRNMTSLRILKMSYLNLDQDFMESHGHDLLGHLQHLEHLDLSYNGLERLPLNMLDRQPRLVELLLAKNRFQGIPVDVSLLPSLQLLDLSKNIITTLSRHERYVFDNLAANHTFYLRMRKNMLSCTCENLDFVQWLENTEVRLDGDNDNDKCDDDYDDNGRIYQCVTEDGTITNTSVINKDIVHQWRRCVGERTLWVALSALCLQLLALFIALLLSRSWTHVRYVINVLRKLKIPRRLDFRKDAYIGYADGNEDMVMEMSECLQKRNVRRLLLRYVEELPGSVKAENIVENIDDSWKVVILVTSQLTLDPWAAFTIYQAQNSIKDTMPDRVIIVCIDDPVLLHHVTSLQHLLRMVPERNVFYIPRGTPPNHQQWDRLAEAILHEER